MAPSVKQISLLLPRLEEHPIRVLAGIYLGEGLQRFQIDDTGFVFPPVARDASPKLGRGRKAVDSRSIGDFAGNGFLVEVNDDNFGPVAHIEATTGFIHRRVIPSALAADRDFLQKVIRAIRSAGRSARNAEDAQGENA